ncbi:MAG: hypothetical protein WC141_01930 [Arcobacteraceae bacterium]
METSSVTSAVIFLVFVIALMAFSLSPAIWISEKLSKKSPFIEQHSRKITILLTLTFSVLAAIFILII